MIENAKYMIITDPVTCVGCRRCELVCTEYNLGKAKPSIAGIKVSRSANFGPGGSAFEGMGAAHHGIWGDGRIIAETCRQCPHPVPCLRACKKGAIEVTGPWNARVVNEEKCNGCGLCVKACHWGMITVDNETKKARKCDLCGGDPECIKVCPTGSIKLISRANRTEDVSAGLPVTGDVGD